MVYTVCFFPLQNAVCFIILTYLVPVLFTFYVQGVLKLKKNNSGSERLICGSYTAYIKKMLEALSFDPHVCASYPTDIREWTDGKRLAADVISIMSLYLFSLHGITSRETWILATKVQGCYILYCTDLLICVTVFFSLDWPCEATFATECRADSLISAQPFVPVASASNYFKVVHSTRFFKPLCSDFISPTKSTVLIICRR